MICAGLLMPCTGARPVASLVVASVVPMSWMLNSMAITSAQPVMAELMMATRMARGALRAASFCSSLICAGPS